MNRSIPLTHADLADHPPPRGPTLGDFGVRLSRELFESASAIADALSALRPDDDRDIDEAVLAAMPAKRAAAKRQAIRQRKARGR